MSNQTTLRPGPAPALAYLRGQVETSDPAKTMVLLFNRLIRELKVVADAFDASIGDATLSSDVLDKLKRCRDIIAYFMDLLGAAADDATERVAAIYSYALEQILTAEMEKDRQYIDVIVPSLELLRDHWAQLQEQGEVD